MFCLIWASRKKQEKKRKGKSHTGGAHRPGTEDRWLFCLHLVFVSSTRPICSNLAAMPAKHGGDAASSLSSTFKPTSTNVRLCQRYATRLLHVAKTKRRQGGGISKKRQNHRSKECQNTCKTQCDMYIHALKIILRHYRGKASCFISRALIVFKKKYIKTKKTGHVFHHRDG